MPRAFAGSTAAFYRRYRRDVPGEVLDRLVGALGVGPDDTAVDLGAGTGQVAVPLAARVGRVLALDPEPDMLDQLRRRGEEERFGNLLCLLASDRDLPLLTGVLGTGACALVTVANALHWMDATAVFAACADLLRPGGGLAVVTHGVPLWLTEEDWARALRRFLEEWTGRPGTSACGSDAAALGERRALLGTAGFGEVAVLEHRYRAAMDAGYVVGHLLSALPEAAVPVGRREEFTVGVRRVLEPFGEPLVEDVPVTVLVGRR